MSEILAVLVDFAWGMPLILLLVVGGLYLLWVSKFIPLRGLRHSLRLISGKFHHSEEEKADGQVSHFQALTAALSATVGLGNISGVAIAVMMGGPGAIFWMWVTALIGMNTKFFECTLSVMFRGKDYRGEVQGGPMYVIQAAMPKPLKFLGPMFALCGLLGTLALFQVNQLSSYLKGAADVNPQVTGGVVAVLVAYILLGGIQRIVKVTSAVVPAMCLVYVVACLGVIVMNLDQVPKMFVLIFQEAFQVSAVGSGAWAGIFLMILKTGVKRAAFSNEAGMGTAPMAHGNVKTNEPVSEGLVAMIGPFLDTIIVCTMTALVVLISFPELQFKGAEGIWITLQAFNKNYGYWGKHLLGVAVVLFSFTTIVGMANYNTKCWDFLFKGRRIFGRYTFIAFYAITIFIGSTLELNDVINLIDTGFALMAFPNMIATLYLAPKVKEAMVIYFEKYKI